MNCRCGLHDDILLASGLNEGRAACRQARRCGTCSYPGENRDRTKLRLCRTAVALGRSTASMVLVARLADVGGLAPCVIKSVTDDF